MNNSRIAAAVALALAGGAAHAAVPSVAACQAAPQILYVAGSSAAQPAFANAIAVNIFGGTGNLLQFSASNGNFQAFCGQPVSGNGAGLATGNLVVIHYRAEGGSVMGALPIAASPRKAVKFLDLTDPAVAGSPVAVNSSGISVATVATTGTTATVGVTDGFGGPLTTHLVELGVTDVEPSAFVGSNYPKAYSTAVFGTASPAQLSALPNTPLFQQVFGIAVNTTNLNLTGGTIDLSTAAIANILLGNYTNWSNVPLNGTGARASAGQAITLVNREAGSGTRTGASIFFLGTGCGAVATTNNVIKAGPAANDKFSTGDALSAANGQPGAVTYASIDNLPNSKYPNLVFVNINGVAPSNLAAATGSYEWYEEAQVIAGTTPTNAQGGTLRSYLITALPDITNAPNLKDILAIPFVAPNNNAVLPVTASANGSPAIYVNPFSKNSNSCSTPAELN